LIGETRWLHAQALPFIFVWLLLPLCKQRRAIQEQLRAALARGVHWVHINETGPGPRKQALQQMIAEARAPGSFSAVHIPWKDADRHAATLVFDRCLVLVVVGPRPTPDKDLRKLFDADALAAAAKGVPITQPELEAK
jgi:hypothetical protein